MVDKSNLRTRTCVSCDSLLEVYEIDLRRGTRILQCPKCGLLHYYSKDFLGRWRLVRAAKPDPSKLIGKEE